MATSSASQSRMALRVMDTTTGSSNMAGTITGISVRRDHSTDDGAVEQVSEQRDDRRRLAVIHQHEPRWLQESLRVRGAVEGRHTRMHDRQDDVDEHGAGEHGMDQAEQQPETP